MRLVTCGCKTFKGSSSAYCETTEALQRHWRLLASWGLSAWPPGRRQLNLQSPAGWSETKGRRTFLPWLRPHWKNKNIMCLKSFHLGQKSDREETSIRSLTHRGPRWDLPGRCSAPLPGSAAQRCYWWGCLGLASGGRGSVSLPKHSRPAEEKKGRHVVKTQWNIFCYILLLFRAVSRSMTAVLWPV